MTVHQEEENDAVNPGFLVKVRAEQNKLQQKWMARNENQSSIVTKESKQGLGNLNRTDQKP